MGMKREKRITEGEVSMKKKKGKLRKRCKTEGEVGMQREKGN